MGIAQVVNRALGVVDGLIALRAANDFAAQDALQEAGAAALLLLAAQGVLALEAVGNRLAGGVGVAFALLAARTRFRRVKLVALHGVLAATALQVALVAVGILQAVVIHITRFDAAARTQPVEPPRRGAVDLQRLFAARGDGVARAVRRFGDNPIPLKRHGLDRASVNMRQVDEQNTELLFVREGVEDVVHELGHQRQSGTAARFPDRRVEVGETSHCKLSIIRCPIHSITDTVTALPSCL